MLHLGRRAVEASVGLFALLGFVSVPLGEKTGWEHLRALVTTREARAFAEDVLQAATSARGRLLGEPSARPPDPRTGPPRVPSRERPTASGRGPQPEPPRLFRLEDAGALPDASLAGP